MASVINRTDLKLVHSAYLPDYPTNDWIHNPDMSPVNGVPFKYWKVLGDQVLEMTQSEKDAADTTLPYLDKYGYQGKDYKVVRQKIIEGVIAAAGFANLTSEEKEIAARWFAVVKSDRDQVYTTTQQIQLGLVFHKNSIGARESRFLAATMEVYNKLTSTDADTVITDIINGGLYESYVNFGREGTLEGDQEGLFDYINARSSTSYVSTGLSAKGFTPVEDTLANIVTNVMDILQNGNY